MLGFSVRTRLSYAFFRFNVERCTLPAGFTHHRAIAQGKIFGGQAKVEGVSGTWMDLTDFVNFMAGNLTAQVRNIAAVTTAVANGDLTNGNRGLNGNRGQWK